MFLDCRGELENLQRTHKGTGRTCKLHTESPRARNWTHDLLVVRQHQESVQHRVTRAYSIYWTVFQKWISYNYVSKIHRKYRIIKTNRHVQAIVDSQAVFFFFFLKNHSHVSAWNFHEALLVESQAVFGHPLDVLAAARMLWNDLKGFPTDYKLHHYEQGWYFRYCFCLIREMLLWSASQEPKIIIGLLSQLYTIYLFLVL